MSAYATRFSVIALVMGTALPALAADVTIETATGPVTLPASPQRVAVYDVAALDTLAALGVTPAAVPANVYVSYLDDATAEATAVGTLFEPDLEALAGVGPDLIIVGGRSAAQAESLSRVAPVIDMTITRETISEDALARLEAYGTLFEREDQAEELAAAFNERIDETRAAAAVQGTALVVMTNGPKVSAYGTGSRFGWLHDDLGLTPAVEKVEAASHGEAISFEFIREANPDWLIAVDRVAATGAEGESAQETLDNALVAETTAWQSDQVIYLSPTNLYIAGGGYTSMMETMDELLTAFAQ